MKIIHARLRLSTQLNGRTRERCPDVVFLHGENEVASIRTDVEQPHISFADASVDELVIHDDALSRSIDEPVWLAEFARVLAPRGVLTLTLPAAGPIAWLDTMNMYRYVSDISGRGAAPDAALPTGWNRHYTRDNVVALLADAGFEPPSISRQNHAAKEIGLMGGLLWSNWIRGNRDAESRLFPQLGRRDPADRSVLLATTWSISTRKRA